MFISNRRRLYSNIISEDNGDIGKNSKIMLDIYNTFDFLTDDIKNIFDPRMSLSLMQTSPKGNDFDITRYDSPGPSSFSIPVMKLSDKISRRFKYNSDKINSFLSYYSADGMSNNGCDYNIVNPNAGVQFERYENNIYLTTTFTAYSTYVNDVDIYLEGDLFIQCYYSGTITISENDFLTMCYPAVWVDTIELQFTNLYINANEFSSIPYNNPPNMVWTEKTYEGPIRVPSEVVDNGIEGEEPEEYIKSIIVNLPTGVSNSNYKIILREFTITTNVDTTIRMLDNNRLEINCGQYSFVGGSCTVSDVKYWVISW